MKNSVLGSRLDLMKTNAAQASRRLAGPATHPALFEVRDGLRVHSIDVLDALLRAPTRVFAQRLLRPKAIEHVRQVHGLPLLSMLRMPDYRHIGSLHGRQLVNRRLR